MAKVGHKRSRAATAASEPSGRSAASSVRLRVAVVDDNPVTGRLIAAFLRAAEHEPELYATPRPLTQGAAENFDLVVLRAAMRGVDMADIAEYLAATWPELPLVLTQIGSSSAGRIEGFVRASFEVPAQLDMLGEVCSQLTRVRPRAKAERPNMPAGSELPTARQIERFLGDVPEALAALGDALTAADTPTLAAVSIGLEKQCGALGAADMARLTTMLRVLAMDGDHGAAQGLLGELESAYHREFQRLTKLREHLDGSERRKRR